jgi:hypothetical protein
MGEWSEYFEDFPEENPANWIDGNFDPQEAARRRALAAKSCKESQNLQKKINKIIKKPKSQQPRSESDS